jgi:hypothetical protein
MAAPLAIKVVAQHAAGVLLYMLVMGDHPIVASLVSANLPVAFSTSHRAVAI